MLSFPLGFESVKASFLVGRQGIDLFLDGSLVFGGETKDPLGDLLLDDVVVDRLVGDQGNGGLGGDSSSHDEG